MSLSVTSASTYSALSRACKIKVGSKFWTGTSPRSSNPARVSPASMLVRKVCSKGPGLSPKKPPSVGKVLASCATCKLCKAATHSVAPKGSATDVGRSGVYFHSKLMLGASMLKGSA